MKNLLEQMGEAKFFRNADESDEDFKKRIKGMVSKEKKYTEREFEIAYCVGLLNRPLTMDELSVELKTAQEKIDRLKLAIKNGDYDQQEGLQKKVK